MPTSICIKTDLSLLHLAIEIQKLLALPPFSIAHSADTSYYQFEMFGWLVFLHALEEDERASEVRDFPYSFSLQAAFQDHIDTDLLVDRLLPYYAQLLSFHLDVETAAQEKQKLGPHWQVRYAFYRKNPHWQEHILFGEEGWQPAVQQIATTPWRAMHPFW